MIKTLVQGSLGQTGALGLKRQKNPQFRPLPPPRQVTNSSCQGFWPILYAKVIFFVRCGRRRAAQPDSGLHQISAKLGVGYGAVWFLLQKELSLLKELRDWQD